MATDRTTAGEKLASETVACASEPLAPPLGEPKPSTKTLRSRLLLAVAEVTSVRIGSPSVTQRTDTRGSASSIGSARERERRRARAEGSRRGSST
jgi:hypothetical protein